MLATRSPFPPRKRVGSRQSRSSRNSESSESGHLVVRGVNQQPPKGCSLQESLAGTFDTCPQIHAHRLGSGPLIGVDRKRAADLSRNVIEVSAYIPSILPADSSDDRESRGYPW